MNTYSLRKSEIDSSFWEVVSNGTVVREIRITFALKRVPPFFKTLDEIDPWLEKEENRLIKSYAYWLLNQRSYSKKTLSQKLRLKGYSEDKSTKIIGEIESFGYLPDAELAESIVRSKLRQGYGPFYIKQVLKEKGLDSYPIQIDETALKAALQKWDTKLKGKEKPKAIAFLLRKGFSLETINSYF